MADEVIECAPPANFIETIEICVAQNFFRFLLILPVMRA